MNNVNSIAQEISAGQRFAFGSNWNDFSKKIDDARIEAAILGIQRLLAGQDLQGKSFLDVGSGSGLMSLAARNLGMKVTSFDYDPLSVACTEQLKAHYCPADTAWSVHQGSVLDSDFLHQFGRFDVVYSWGVLHHTGRMWEALSNTIQLVGPGGSLIVALYNDQGVQSKIWKKIKAAYNKVPRWAKPFYVFLIMAPREAKIIAVPLLKGKFRFLQQRYFGGGGGGAWSFGSIGRLGAVGPPPRFPSLKRYFISLNNVALI